jgi:hypothetical protein
MRRGRRSPLLCVLIAFLSLPGVPPDARALDIVLVWDDLDENPSWDPNGTQLMAIAQAAAERWERLIDSPGTHTVDVSWSNLDTNQLGLWKFDPLGNNNLYFDSSNSAWFVDPTPSSDEEYDFGDPLDLVSAPGSELVEYFNDTYSYFDQATPPGMLEIAYWGQARDGTGANGNSDLLSVVLHELGHELGIAGDEFSGRYAIYPHHVNGVQDLEVIEQNLEGNNFGEEHGHLAPPEALLSPNLPQSKRVLPSAVDVLAAARDSGYPEVDLARKHAGISGDYDNPLVWIGGQVPNEFDDVYVVDDVTVTLDGFETADDLYVGFGGVLQTGIWDLTVDDEVAVGGNGEVRVQGGGDLALGRLDVRRLGEVVMSGGSLVLENGTVRAEEIGGSYDNGVVRGHGEIEIGSQLFVAGRLAAEGGLLELTGPGSLRLHSFASNGGVLAAVDGDIDLGVGIFSNSVDGRVLVGAGHRITALEDVTFPSSVEVSLGGSASDPALLTSFGADVDVTIHDLSVGANGRIEALRTTLGSVDISQSGNLLTLASPQGTTLTGSVVGDGTLRQAGDLSVQGGVTIFADTFDWGNSTSTQSNVLRLRSGSVLSVRSESLGSTTGSYRGLIQVTSAVLDVDVDGGWTLPADSIFTNLPSGDLALIHDGGANDPVVRGSPFTASGVVAVAGGNAFIEAPITTTPSTDLTVFGNATLFLDAPATLGGGEFTGLGTLVQADDITVTRDTAIEVDGFHWGNSFGANLHTLEVEAGATFTVDSPGTGDPENDFRGVVRLDGGDLVVNTDLPWTLPAAGFLQVPGTLEMHNPDFVSVPSIRGQGLTIGGDVVVTGSGASSIDVELTFQQTATTTVAAGAVLNLNGATSYGSASFGGDGLLRHSGSTFFGGDVFSVPHFAQNGSFTVGDPDGSVEFDNLTTDFEADGTTRLFADLILHGTNVVEGGHVFTGSQDLVVARGARLEGASPNVGVSVVNEGQLAPGFSPGRFELDGDYTQAATGSLEIELGGLAPNIRDILAVSGDLTLDGELEILLWGGFEPVVGDSFDVLDWGGALAGSFASFAFGPGTGPVEWDFGSLYTDGVIRFVPEPTTALLIALGLATLSRGRTLATS